jgi:hypothetical protein
MHWYRHAFMEISENTALMPSEAKLARACAALAKHQRKGK